MEEEIKLGSFWSNQPVPQSWNVVKTVTEDKPLDKIIEAKNIRQTPYLLPEGFEWFSCDIDNSDELEAIYILLRDHYVANNDNTFRFDYSKEFLKWALKPPGFNKEWHLGVRVISNKTIVGFITAIPVIISVKHNSRKMVEINYLCVRKKVRTKRLAPVLIQEITRRVNVQGIFQAVYTAGITLPTPIAKCQYYHRSLNPKKLVEIKFTSLDNRTTLARTIKRYKLPVFTTTPGLRRLHKSDCLAASILLINYLKKFNIYMEFSCDDFEHWFIPRTDVVECFVVENPITHKITDMCSFYSLPFSAYSHPKYKSLNVAYSWYNVVTTTPLIQLMKDVLILANIKGYDVFNCLDIQDNVTFFEELKFKAGDGDLKYYLYNWLTKSMQHKEVGLVLF